MNGEIRVYLDDIEKLVHVVNCFGRIVDTFYVVVAFNIFRCFNI
jgi:hypothetical protein